MKLVIGLSRDNDFLVSENGMEMLNPSYKTLTLI